MVGSVDEALSLRDIGLAQVCMGEVRGRAPPGFDFGNSPFEISDIDFRGKAIAQRTGAGTQGIVATQQSLCSIAGDGQSDCGVAPIAWHRAGFPGGTRKQRGNANRRG